MAAASDQADFWVFENEHRHKTRSLSNPGRKRLNLSICLDYEARSRFSGIRIEVLADETVDVRSWMEPEPEAHSLEMPAPTRVEPSSEGFELYHLRLLLSSKPAKTLHGYRFLRNLTPSLENELKLDPKNLRRIYEKSYPGSAAELLSYLYDASFILQESYSYLNSAESWDVSCRVAPVTTKRVMLDIPEEIIRLIVGRTYVPGSNTLKCARCILAFSSVSRLWYSSIIDLLWNRPEWATTILKPHRFAKLMEVVRSNKEFARRITYFPYINSRCWQPEKQKILLDDAQFIFDAAPKLKLIHTSPPFVKRCREQIKALDYLESFTVEDAEHTSMAWEGVVAPLRLADLASALNHMKHLREVRLHWIRRQTDDVLEDLPTAAYSLIKFSVCQVMVNSRFFRHLFSNPVQNLKRLRMDIVEGLSNADLNHLFACCAHSLEDIYLWNCALVDEDIPPSSRAFNVWAPKMEKLSKATIHGELITTTGIAAQPRSSPAAYLEIIEFQYSLCHTGLKDALHTTGWKIVNIQFDQFRTHMEPGQVKEEMHGIKKYAAGQGVDFRWKWNIVESEE